MRRLIVFTAFLSLPASPVWPADGEPAWLPAALALVPPGHVAGRVVETSADGLSVRIAVYPEGSDDPRSPASAFDPGEVLVVTLGDAGGGRLMPEGAELFPRAPDQPVDDPPPPGSEADYARLHRDLLNRANYISGTEPCDLAGWSVDTDPAGLNVRLRPTPEARILGTLPPPFRFGAASEAAPEGGFRTEFDIIGYQDGWFLIEHARPPGRDYVDAGDYPDDHPEPFAGRGWVRASLVGAQYANGDTMMGGLFQAPHADSRWTPALNKFGEPVSADGGPKRILACSGLWALVESHDGVVGWWRRLCSSQVTNCS